MLDEELCRPLSADTVSVRGFIFGETKGKGRCPGWGSDLGFLTGPLTGTPALGGSRYTVVGKSPLTGGWGDANSGGDFGPYLKFAGYDALFFTGISKKPVYFVNEGRAEIRDALHLWGKNCYETEDILKSELGRTPGSHASALLGRRFPGSQPS